MTEEEAKTKTCHLTVAPVANADGGAPWFAPQACIGSACMAWRCVALAKDSNFAAPYAGFCGLAGKP